MERSNISFKVRQGYLVVPKEKIMFCKAEGSYSTVYIIGGKSVLVSKSLAIIEDCLGQDFFVRCHNSYLVNISKVELFDSKNKRVTIMGHLIPVSRRKVNSLIHRLNSFNYHL